MYIRSIFIVIAILVTSRQAGAQALLIDSLKQTLSRNDLSPKEHIITMALLARAYSRTDTTKALVIVKEVIERSWKLKDPATTSFAYSIQAMLLYYKSHVTGAAYAAMDSAFYYAQQSRDKRMLGICWYRKGWLQGTQSKFQESVGSYMTALKNLEGTNAFEYEASIYSSLAQVHGSFRDYPQQYKYARLSLEAAKKSKDPDNIAAAYSTIASHYLEVYENNNKRHALLDTALLNFRKCINVYQKHGGRMVFYRLLPVIALNVAMLYQQYPVSSHAKDSADHYLKISINSSSSTDKSRVISKCYGMMAEYEMSRGNFKQAEETLLAGLAIMQTIDTIKQEGVLKMKVLEKLITVAEKQGDYRKAFRYQKEHHKLYVARFDAERLAIAKRLEAQYQSDKDHAALLALQQTNALNERLNIVYIALSVTIALILLLLLWSFRSRLKVTLQQKKLLEIEKEEAALTAQLKQQENKQLALEKMEAELKARLREEEALRLQAEQKLMQEIQGRLQKDLLAGSLQIEQKDELLHTVQKKIEASAKDTTIVRQINNIIDKSKKTDESFAASRAEFDAVHPEFFEQLRVKSEDSLSRLDLKHCAYISIGLTNKEIAQRLGVAPKSILMARYRIKLKLGLGKEEDLDEFINKLN